jgi:hypothetical protein
LTCVMKSWLRLNKWITKHQVSEINRCWLCFTGNGDKSKYQQNNFLVCVCFNYLTVLECLLERFFLRQGKYCISVWARNFISVHLVICEEIWSNCPTIQSNKVDSVVYQSNQTNYCTKLNFDYI